MVERQQSIVERTRSAQQQARELYPVLRRQARRPFVLEITGTPKAGKTTLIGMLDSFLRACGWRVHVLKERASECPLPMKGHFFFNTWTTGTMLAGLLDAVDREHDIVILDRGIFDALIWLSLQEKQGQVSQDEKAAFEGFVMLDRWRRLVDRVCLVETDPAVAMDRENHSRLVRRSGSIMNRERLADFNKAMRQLARQSTAEFELMTLKNVAGAKQGALDLIETVLQSVRAWCDPQIAVVAREDAEALVPTRTVPWSRAVWTKLRERIRYRRRSTVENDDRWVQLVHCGVQTHGGKLYLVVRRPQRDRAPHERDHTAKIWQGGHVTRPARGQLQLEHLAQELKSRLEVDLHLGELRAEPRPKGLVWNPEGREPRHMGLVFEVPVTSNLAEWLDEKDFKTNGRGYQLESSFVTRGQLTSTQLKKRGYTVEDWSKLILREGWLP